MTKYKLGEADVKHNNALETLVRATPQTHTHGDVKLKHEYTNAVHEELGFLTRILLINSPYKSSKSLTTSLGR